MSLRLGPGYALQNFPLTPEGRIKPEWLSLFRDFPDRFMIGADEFIASPASQGSGVGAQLARRAPMTRQMTPLFLSALPLELANEFRHDTPVSFFRLKE